MKKEKTFANGKMSVTKFSIISLCRGLANFLRLKRLFGVHYWYPIGLSFKMSNKEALSEVECLIFG